MAWCQASASGELGALPAGLAHGPFDRRADGRVGVDGHQTHPQVGHVGRPGHGESGFEKLHAR